ncbi:hypothetical protein [Microbacterium sp. NPDC089696]|uniref:hypothetical protein n=1 Tax=Microbacterium sp. NPDC089696 TaxID=3364199 RepID=UPI003818200C
MSSPTWGIVAEPVRRVLQRLHDLNVEAADATDTASVAGDMPQNHDAAFNLMSAASETADRATRDYRSIFNAYTHKFHQPKPPISELAARQGVIIQSFAKRYTPKTIAAIDALLSNNPDLAAIRAGIRSLGFEDLWGISDALDRVLTEAQAKPGFVPWGRIDDTIDAVQRELVKKGASRSPSIPVKTGFEDMRLPGAADENASAQRLHL